MDSGNGQPATPIGGNATENLVSRAADDLNAMLYGVPNRVMVTEYPLTVSVKGRQVETFDQPFKRTASGEYESAHIVKTTYRGDNKPPDRSERGTLRMLADGGEIVLFATYQNSDGTSQSYGPWVLERNGDGIAFVDPKAAMGGFAKWVMYRSPDGTLAADRHFGGGTPESNHWAEDLSVRQAEAMPDAAQGD